MELYTLPYRDPKRVNLARYNPWDFAGLV
jgi:hypothetical protein